MNHPASSILRSLASCVFVLSVLLILPSRLPAAASAEGEDRAGPAASASKSAENSGTESQGAVEDYSDLDLQALLSQEVSLASLKKESVREAPSIVTVITREEIEAMGIKTLEELFNVIPGFYYENDFEGDLNTYVRGIPAASRTKVYLDGHSLNTLRTGSYGPIYREIPLENVKKVEVIRGPGSALYGTSALVAVINIITREADDVDGFEGRVWGGSYNTVGGSATYGGVSDDLSLVLSAIGYRSDGDQAFISEDSLGYSGNTDTKKRIGQLALKLRYKGLRLLAHYKRNRTGAYRGIVDHVTPDNNKLNDVFFIDALWEKELSDRIRMSLRAYFDHRRDANLYEALAPGDTFYHPVVGPILFPDGAFGNIEGKELAAGGEGRLIFKLFEENELTTGIFYEFDRQYDVRSSGNFDPVTFFSKPTWTDYGGNLDWTKDADRHVFSLYAQDAWRPADWLNLVAGVRWDHYSDFGNTVNPRAGVVVSATDDLTFKVLYGSAFRAPAFDDLYLQNNPTLVGNPNLDAEKLYSVEAGVTYQYEDYASVGLNYYSSFLSDGIIPGPKPSPLEPSQNKNLGGTDVHGFDLELKGGYKKYFYVYGHYSYAHSTSYTHLNSQYISYRTPSAPRHMGLFGLNLSPNRHVNFNGRVTVIGGRSRDRSYNPDVPPDTRPDADPKALLDATVWLREILPGTDLKASIYNATNEDYRYLSPRGDTVPVDYPTGGRHFLAEVIFRY